MPESFRASSTEPLKNSGFDAQLPIPSCSSIVSFETRAVVNWGCVVCFHIKTGTILMQVYTHPYQ